MLSWTVFSNASPQREKLEKTVVRDLSSPNGIEGFFAVPPQNDDWMGLEER